MYEYLKPIIGDEPVTTLDEVLNVLKQIDAELPETDGLRWFNWLYIEVTTRISMSPPRNGWSNSEWVVTLDVLFANLYFDAIRGAIEGKQVPMAWQVLFDSADKSGIDNIQFALAGMNAHINHDLTVALWKTGELLGVKPGMFSRERRDYDHINRLLDNLMPIGISSLNSGVWGGIAQATGKAGEMFANLSMRLDRHACWTYAGRLLRMRTAAGIRREVMLRALDASTGSTGLALLGPKPTPSTAFGWTRSVVVHQLGFSTRN